MDKAARARASQPRDAHPACGPAGHPGQGPGERRRPRRPPPPGRPVKKRESAARSRAARAGPSSDAVNVFQRYLRSLQAAEVLPREEEKRLALAYRDQGDSDAAARLVRGNLRLVVKIAEEYGRNEDQLMDLIQEGNLGLLHALEKFDPDRGVKLSSYAAWWMRAYILQFVLAQLPDRPAGDHAGPAQAVLQAAPRARAAGAQRRRGGRQPAGRGPGGAAQRRVRDGDAAGLARGVAGRPAARRRRAARRLATSCPGRSRRPARPAARVDEFRTAAAPTSSSASASSLSGRERQIFSERLISDHPLTLQELGRRYGVSRERARQLESRLKEKIRVHLEAEFADAQVLREAA